MRSMPRNSRWLWLCLAVSLVGSHLVGCQSPKYEAIIPDNSSFINSFSEAITPQPITLRVAGTPSNDGESVMEEIHKLEEVGKLNLARQRPADIDLPLRYGPVDGYLSSGFGIRWGGLHKGIDLAAPAGTEVLALASGVVVRSAWARGYGQLVAVRHSHVQETLYAHLSRRNVNVGDRVTKGEKIGEVGATGKATGPHVHLEVRIEGRAVDPL